MAKKNTTNDTPAEIQVTPVENTNTESSTEIIEERVVVVEEQPVVKNTESAEIRDAIGQDDNVQVEVKNTQAPEQIMSDEDLLKQQNNSTDFSVFKNKRIERAYIDSEATSSAKTVERVPEVEFKKTGAGATSSTGAGATSATTGAGSTTTTTTPALTPEQQKVESEMLANALIGAYRQLNGLGAWAVKVDDTKIIEWKLDDLISDDMELPCNQPGVMINPTQFWAAFGSAVDEASHIPDDHFNQVRESMIREFTKRGLGLSDMANIVQFFTRDILMRAGNFYSLYRQRVINTKQLFNLYEQQKLILAAINGAKNPTVATTEPQS